jgi:twinkle protein
MSDGSTCLTHEPCPQCGSKDNLGRYDDGHGFCFGCNYYEPGGEGAHRSALPPETGSRQTAGLVEGFVPEAGLPHRGLSAATCKLWRYEVGHTDKGTPVQIANYISPKTGKVVAQKLRTKQKDFVATGDFKNAPLYGQHLWANDAKGINRLVIVEGEIDAMSVSQLQNHKWPVVSIKNGAAGARKSLAKELEWLGGFNEIVLMLDNDEPGRTASIDCADLFEIGKCKIATLPLKDANEMLVAGRGDELIKAIWNARVYRPDGVLGAFELKERVHKRRTSEDYSVPYPYKGLNEVTGGARPGELVLITAASGTGKSSFVREIAVHLHDQGETVGLVFLEEDAERTLEGLVSIKLGVPYESIRDVPEQNFDAAFDALFADERFFLVDHWGSSDADELLSRIRFLAKGCGCRFVILDHITIAMSGLEVSDERRALDVLMTRLRKVVQETGIGMFVISHLSRPEGNKGHEEGLQISTKHLRGSHSLVQLSDMAIALERNQQAENEAARTLAKVRVLKNRFSGRTGPAGALRYSTETGRLTEVATQFEPVGDDDNDNSDF